MLPTILNLVLWGPCSEVYAKVWKDPLLRKSKKLHSKQKALPIFISKRNTGGKIQIH